MSRNTSQAGDFRHKTSDFRHKTSDTRLQTQDFRLQTQDFRHKTSDFRHKTQVTYVVRRVVHARRCRGTQQKMPRRAVFLKHKRDKSTQKPAERFFEKSDLLGTIHDPEARQFSQNQYRHTPQIIYQHRFERLQPMKPIPPNARFEYWPCQQVAIGSVPQMKPTVTQRNDFVFQANIGGNPDKE